MNPTRAKAADIVSAACIEAVNVPTHPANAICNMDTLRELIKAALDEIEAKMLPAPEDRP